MPRSSATITATGSHLAVDRAGRVPGARIEGMGNKWTADDVPDQTGRTILITGANSALGLRSAEALATKGARVLLACRDAERGATALEAVKAKATAAAPELRTLDL